MQVGSSVTGSLSVKVTAAGNYYVWVSDDNYNAVGSFSLTVQRGNNPGGSTPVNFGDTVTGTLASNADVAFYSLSAQANDTIMTALGKTGGLSAFVPLVRLYDSNGVQLASSTASTLTIKAPATGTYYFWISDDNYNSTGGYQFSVVENLLTNVTKATPRAFDPVNGETTSFQFTLDRASLITVQLYKAFLDVNGAYQRQLVGTIASSVSMPAGLNTFSWNGRDSAGTILAPSAYIFTVQAVNGSRNVLYDPVYVPGTVQIQNAILSPAQFDPYQGETAIISYDLLTPAWVKLKAGTAGEATAKRVLINNEPRDVLDNVEYWDGRDDNGNILGSSAYIVAGWTTILPDNAIILKGNLGIDSITTQPYAFYPMYNQSSEIAYTISRDAKVSVLIQTPDGTATVRALVNDQLKTAGTYTVVWNGKDDFGNIIVTPGNYRIHVTAANPAGTSSVTRKGNITVLTVK